MKLSSLVRESFDDILYSYKDCVHRDWGYSLLDLSHDEKVNSLKQISNVPSTVPNIDAASTNIKNLEGFPKKISGVLLLANNKNLETLEGTLTQIGEKARTGETVLDISNCPKLKSFKNINKIFTRINGKINFTDTPIESNILGLIEIAGLSGVKCSDKTLEKIINSSLESQADLFDFQNALIDAGYDHLTKY